MMSRWIEKKSLGSFIKHVVKFLSIFNPSSWSLLYNKAYVIKWSFCQALPLQLSTWFMDVLSVYSLRRDIQSLHQFYIVFSISIQKNPSRVTQSPYFPYFTHFFSIGLLQNIEVSKGNAIIRKAHMKKMTFFVKQSYCTSDVVQSNLPKVGIIYIFEAQ